MEARRISDRVVDRRVQRAASAECRPARDSGAQNLSGFKFEEIAEILSCPVSTVKSRCIPRWSCSRRTCLLLKREAPYELFHRSIYGTTFFGELPEEGRRQVDLHTKGCSACRES